MFLLVFDAKVIFLKCAIIENIFISFDSLFVYLVSSLEYGFNIEYAALLCISDASNSIISIDLFSKSLSSADILFPFISFGYLVRRHMPAISTRRTEICCLNSSEGAFCHWENRSRYQC